MTKTQLFKIYLTRAVFGTMLVKYKVKRAVYSYLLWVAKKRDNYKDILHFTIGKLVCGQIIIKIYEAQIELIDKLEEN